MRWGDADPAPDSPTFEFCVILVFDTYFPAMMVETLVMTDQMETIQILHAHHASQRRRHPPLDGVYGRLSLALFGATVTMEKTAVETMAMT